MRLSIFHLHIIQLFDFGFSGSANCFYKSSDNFLDQWRIYENNFPGCRSGINPKLPIHPNFILMQLGLQSTITQVECCRVDLLNAIIKYTDAWVIVHIMSQRSIDPPLGRLNQCPGKNIYRIRS